MRKVLMMLALCGLAAGAQAQEMARIDTPSGPAVITRSDIDAIVSVGGQEFRFEGMLYAGFAERLGDVVLLSLSMGGTACPGVFAWLDTRPGMIRVTDVFGTCSDLHEVTWDAEAVTVSMPSLVPGEGMVDFVWDGKTAAVREVVRGPESSGLPPGGPVRAWESRYGLDLLAGADWAPVLLPLMGEAALTDAQRIVQVGYPFAVQGDWLVSTGCQPHQCDVTMGAVALHLADGALIVALWEEGVGPRAWGDLTRGLPPGVAEVMAGR